MSPLLECLGSIVVTSSVPRYLQFISLSSGPGLRGAAVIFQSLC